MSSRNLEISISNCSDTLVPPRITARNPEVSVSVGEVAELECVAHGNPQVQQGGIRGVPQVINFNHFFIFICAIYNFSPLYKFLLSADHILEKKRRQGH